MKRQLVRASLAAIEAVRAVDARARFVHAEPIINIVADDEEPDAIPDAARHTASQFEAWDMLRGGPGGGAGWVAGDAGPDRG